MYCISNEEYHELLEGLADSGNCPYGKQVTGCPVDLHGDVIECRECWAEYLYDYGLTEGR